MRRLGVAELAGDDVVGAPDRPQFVGVPVRYSTRPSSAASPRKRRTAAGVSALGSALTISTGTAGVGGVGTHFIERAADLLGDQWAGRVAGRGEEGQDRDAPAVLAQRDAPPGLVGEREVGRADTAAAEAPRRSRCWPARFRPPPSPPRRPSSSRIVRPGGRAGRRARGRARSWSRRRAGGARALAHTCA